MQRTSTIVASSMREQSMMPTMALGQSTTFQTMQSDAGTAGFYFKKRQGSFDWRALSGVDPDRIARDVCGRCIATVTHRLTWMHYKPS